MRFVKNHPDAFVTLILLVFGPVVIFLLHREGMHFSGYVAMWVHVAIFLYFIIWLAFIKRKREARRIMGREGRNPDPFSEGDYYNRTGISGMRINPWPRPRDQWDARRNTWDTGIERRNWRANPPGIDDGVDE